MAQTKVLVVEDDQTLRSVLEYNLAKEGYRVLTAEDGVEALELARVERPHLVILDIMLPKMDGLEVCRILRKESAMPILMLTARVEEVDKVVGLELGADDYVTKPFGMRELLARVRAMLRRVPVAEGLGIAPDEAGLPLIKAGDLEIDVRRHRVLCRGSQTDLTPTEFALLAFLARNAGRVFTRDQLLQNVWGYDYAGDTRTVDVHIRWLRQKIEADPSRPRHLLTVRGVGYKLEA
jgi:two-component system OmpR family response regulator